MCVRRKQKYVTLFSFVCILGKGDKKERRSRCVCLLRGGKVEEVGSSDWQRFVRLPIDGTFI